MNALSLAYDYLEARPMVAAAGLSIGLSLLAGAAFGQSYYTCELEPIPGTNAFQLADPDCQDGDSIRRGTVGNERWIERSIVEDVLGRGIWDGSEQDRFRITTMGVAESNGANVVRVRNPDGRAIEVRIGNNPPVIETAGQGEAFFEVPAGGGYAVYDDATGERLHGTASTNSNPFDDITEVEVETEIEGGSKF